MKPQEKLQADNIFMFEHKHPAMQYALARGVGGQTRLSRNNYLHKVAEWKEKTPNDVLPTDVMLYAKEHEQPRCLPCGGINSSNFLH